MPVWHSRVEREEDVCVCEQEESVQEVVWEGWYGSRQLEL